MNLVFWCLPLRLFSAIGWVSISTMSLSGCVYIHGSGGITLVLGVSLPFVLAWSGSGQKIIRPVSFLWCAESLCLWVA